MDDHIEAEESAGAREPSVVDVFLGSRIAYLRLRRGLTQQALAQRIGLTASELDAYESGAEPLCGGALALLSSGLDEDLADFRRSLIEAIWLRGKKRPMDHQRRRRGDLRR